MAKEKTKVISPYQAKIHRFGRITNIIAVLALTAVPLILSLTTNIEVDIPTTIKAFIGVGSLMGIMVVVEFMSYAPMLGAGATYLTFITGNTMNLKLPSAMSSIKLAEVEVGSKEAEVISTMAVAVSSLVTIAVLLVGMIGLGFILPVLQSPGLKPAFDNLMPALMGGLGAPYILKDLKTAAMPMAIAVILTVVMGYGAFTQMISMALPVFLIITVLWRYVLYRREQKKASE